MCRLRKKNTLGTYNQTAPPRIAPDYNDTKVENRLGSVNCTVSVMFMWIKNVLTLYTCEL